MDAEYEKFIREHGKPLFGYALRWHNGDKQRSEDAFQEFVIKFYRYWNSTESREIAYAYRTLDSVCVDLHRKDKRARENKPLGPDEEEIKDGRTEAQYEQVESEPDAALNAAVNQLDYPLRRVIFMTYWQKLNPRDIEQLFGISSKQVSRDLYRALQKLRSMLLENPIYLESRRRGR
ncbi:sigma-70 family RNA polymerase sigma factor [Actinosynnema sp. NPDC023658]|uniref:RNA polymerase sigma factor n=1 Tax=Actinosynnema sp. NPDC023658 TaxID=3155465 RepID=UPI0033F7B26C